MKEIEFTNANIVHYTKTLDANNKVPMTITVGSAALDNRCPKK